MTKLIITRTSEWNNKARKFGIYLNNEKIGVVENGEKKEFEIEPGNHKINGKIDWCKSPKLELKISENETKKIEFSGYKYGRLFSRISLGLILIFFLMLIIFKIKLTFLIYISVIGFLYNMYFITFGKNRYLTIREVK
jgi:hypothetical protein